MGVLRRPVYPVTVLTACLLGVAGCGGTVDKHKANRPKTVAVSGKLTYKGAPVADAALVFAPTETGGVAASSRTDSGGVFLPKAFPPDSGMVPGVYKVVVTKVEQPAAPAAEPAGGHDAPSNTVAVKHLLPRKYADASTTDFSVTITEAGTDSLAIELKD